MVVNLTSAQLRELRDFAGVDDVTVVPFGDDVIIAIRGDVAVRIAEDGSVHTLWSVLHGDEPKK